jgi:hypothetical protein
VLLLVHQRVVNLLRRRADENGVLDGYGGHDD